MTHALRKDSGYRAGRSLRRPSGGLWLGWAADARRQLLLGSSIPLCIRTLRVSAGGRRLSLFKGR